MTDIIQRAERCNRFPPPPKGHKWVGLATLGPRDLRPGDVVLGKRTYERWVIVKSIEPDGQMTNIYYEGGSSDRRFFTASIDVLIPKPIR